MSKEIKSMIPGASLASNYKSFGWVGSNWRQSTKTKWYK